MFCNRCAHIHIPRTAGSLVRALFLHLLMQPGLVEDVFDGPHGSLERAQAMYPGTSGFTIVRDPWDWWVSRWSRDVEVGRCDSTFADYLSDGPRPEEVYRSETDWWQGLGADGISPNLIGRYEKLEEEVCRLFNIFFSDLLTPDEIRLGFHRAGRPRATAWRVPYPLYYREQWMIDDIAEKDDYIIQRFGYSFPDAASTSFSGSYYDERATGRLLELLRESLGLSATCIT